MLKWLFTEEFRKKHALKKSSINEKETSGAWPNLWKSFTQTHVNSSSSNTVITGNVSYERKVKNGVETITLDGRQLDPNSPEYAAARQKYETHIKSFQKNMSEFAKDMREMANDMKDIL